MQSHLIFNTIRLQQLYAHQPSLSQHTPPLVNPPQLPISYPPQSSPNLIRFISFLRVAFQVTKEGAVAQTLTQEAIVEDPDYHLPFRQLAPSKKIILADPNGPFSPTRLKTREGLFDALIFRLITQASPFLLEEKQLLFGFPAQFHEAVKGKDTHHFCNPYATGRHSRSHNIPYIDTYWKHTVDWETYTDGDVTIETLLTWFTGKEGKATRFFGMGNLVGWLLASDYAYAGLVGLPDASKVGEIIFRINAGAKGGLELLGFDVSTKKSCMEAMSSLWLKVQGLLSPEEIHEMGIEPITLEHALCKFQRLYKKYISKVF